MQDDPKLTNTKRDLSGGVNSRQHEQIIGDNQATKLENIILDTVGQRAGRSGVTLVQELTYDSYTKLLIHFDGVDAATTYTAETGQTVTFGGDAQLDTAQKVFGASSLLLDGTGDYCTVPNSSDWDFAASDFTLECRAGFAAVPAANGDEMTLIDRLSTQGNAQKCWALALCKNSGVLKIQLAYSTDGTSTLYFRSNEVSVVVNTWYHIRFVRYGDVGTFYLDGTESGIIDLTGITLYDSSRLVSIGAFTDGSVAACINGWIDEVRISNVARCTEAFVKPTAPYGSFAEEGGTGLYGFMPEGGTNELMATVGTNLLGWIGSGEFTNHKTDFTTSLFTTMVKVLESDEQDALFISNGTDHCFRMTQTHTFQDLNDGSTSPPLTTVYTWFRDRLWGLKDNKLYYSGAIPVDFSVAFQRSLNYYNIPIGKEKALLGLRDTGIIVGGTDAIWGLNPSLTPAPATDKPEKILDIGLIAPFMTQVGDDVWFLSSDGVRGLFRTQQDKLQSGSTFPLSWNIKEEIEDINWAQAATKADGVYFDNKFLMAFPSGSSTYNNRVIVAYPALRDSNGLPAWVVFTGLNISRFAKIQISGQERLYGIDSVNGKVVRLFYGTSDDGTAIAVQEESRADDFQKPLQKKYGGEFKLKLLGGIKGGSGTVEVHANPDNRGWYRIGVITITDIGVTFPATFPVVFLEGNELSEQFHLDIPEIGQFKRIKFKIYCNTLDASLTILESIVTTFLEEYQSED